MEKPDKEQIDPEDEDESTKDDKSPKRTRSHSRESLKDKRKSRRSRSRSRSPRKKREKSAGEESASEGEINWKTVEQRWLHGMRSWVNVVVQEDYEYLSQVFPRLQEETVVRGARRIPLKPTLISVASLSRQTSIFAGSISPLPYPRQKFCYMMTFSRAISNQSETLHSVELRHLCGFSREDCRILSRDLFKLLKSVL